MRYRLPTRPALIFALIATCLLSAGVPGLPPASNCYGDEPAELFLQRLKAEQYYDVALGYLDNLDSYPGISSELRDAVDLERAQIHLEAAGAARIAAEREEAFEAGERALQDFIKTKPDHPRVSEARMMLGTRQLIHAMVLSRSPKLDDAVRERARTEYLEAAKTFDKIIETLKVALQEMPTGQIDETENPGLTERREQYRSEYMQAQLQAGQTRRLAAETFANPARDGKDLLEASLQRLQEFSEKYSGFPPGARAMLYRGQVQQMLGQSKAALESYQRVQEQVEDDRLRSIKIEAATGTVQLRLAESPPQFKAAIERGQPWIDEARPNERRTNEIQQLRLALAKAYLVRAENSEKAKDRKDATSSARQLLNDAKRVPGDHAEETTELLATLGVDTTSDEPVVSRPNSLDEAIEAAKTLIETGDTLALTEQLLLSKMKEPDADKAAIEQELASVQENVQTQRKTAALLLQQGLALVRPGDDTAPINQARNFLTYTLFRLGRFREAAAVGEFMATTSPGDPLGLSGGVTALNALQSLVREAPEELREEVLTSLSSVGNLLVKHWPEEPAVAGARGALIAVALNREDWDEARKHLDATPDDAPDKAYFLRVMGNLMWNRYLLRLQADKEDATAAELLPVAEKDLAAGLKPLKPADVTQRELDAALILAKVLIRQERENEALTVLENPNFGPLKLAGKGDQDYQFKVYTTALQVIIGQMTSMNADTAGLTKKAGDIVKQMQAIAGNSEEAKSRMADNFKSLARDIREQLEAAPPAKKETLMTAFETLMTGLVSADNDPSTLLMVGQSFAQIGEGAMPNPDRPATGKAAELLTSASEMLNKAVTAQSDQETKLKTRYQLARVERLRGEYSSSLKELEEIVKVKPTMLTAQEEAALTYEQWGLASADSPSRAAKAHELAIMGSRPDDKGKNQIWGWGTIGKRTGNNVKFKEAFFNARYHLALNRFLQGKALNDESKMRDGIKFTKDLIVFYPDMGGDDWRPKFDRLVRDIQTAIGDPVKGLEAFESP